MGAAAARDSRFWLLGPLETASGPVRLDQHAPTLDVPGLSGVFLTHAHIGHYTGLMHFGHEVMGAKGVPVYAMPRMAEFLSTNGPWDQLVRYGNVAIRPLQADHPVILNDRLSVTPFIVPHRDEYSETVGYRIDGPNKSALFIPDIHKWEFLDTLGVTIEELVQSVDLAFLDGSFYSSSEVGGRDMSDFPHPFIVESLKRFESLDPESKSKIYFIHLNHTNPAFDESSEAYASIVSAGFSVSREGQCFGL